MSTTVSYKGQTLTTVSNDTKTLLTEGKYLEDDLTLVDVSGGGSTLITKNISENGTYNASSDSADGYSQVTVAVPASAVDSGTKSITSNGTHDVVGYASASVSVPNSYSASDEGKVVSNGALVAQTAHADVTPTTSDQTIDTTTNNSIKVKGDADLVASNIKKDVEIFGVTGSYEGGGGGGDTFAEICNGTVNSYESDELIKIPQNTLRSNTTLTSIKIYKCQDIASYGLGGFRGTAIALPSYKGNLFSDGFPFNGSSTLQKIDIGEDVVRLYNNFLNGANAVNTVIIRKKTIPTLSNVNAFNNNVFKSGGTGGTIYIPKVLYDALGTGTNDYKAASNWSTLDGYGTVTWAKIEGSIYENAYADGTQIPTT